MALLLQNAAGDDCMSAVQVDYQMTATSLMTARIDAASAECFTVPLGQTLLPAAPCDVMNQMGHDALDTCSADIALFL
jgi:hypothetical protein